MERRATGSDRGQESGPEILGFEPAPKHEGGEGRGGEVVVEPLGQRLHQRRGEGRHQGGAGRQQEIALAGGLAAQPAPGPEQEDEGAGSATEQVGPETGPALGGIPGQGPGRAPDTTGEGGGAIAQGQDPPDGGDHVEPAKEQQKDEKDRRVKGDADVEATLVGAPQGAAPEVGPQPEVEDRQRDEE